MILEFFILKLANPVSIGIYWLQILYEYVLKFAYWVTPGLNFRNV